MSFAELNKEEIPTKEKIQVIAWKDHHLGLTNIKTLNNLFAAIHSGQLWTYQDKIHDQKLTITIEEE